MLLQSFGHTIFTVKHAFEKSSCRLLVGINLLVYVYKMLFSLSTTQNCRNFPEVAAGAVPSKRYILVRKQAVWHGRGGNSSYFLPFFLGGGFSFASLQILIVSGITHKTNRTML